VLSSLIFPACFAALHKRTPVEHLGKVGGFRGVLQGALAIPILAAHGVLLDGWGLHAAYVFMALICLGMAISVVFWRLQWEF
jgi:succinate-acetate transporter protein